MKRCVVYARKSTDDASPSVDDQLAIGRTYAADHDYFVVDEIADRGVSGTTFERPGWQRVMTLASEKKIDIIIAKSRDRISRNDIDFFVMREQLLAPLGVKLEYAQEAQEEDTFESFIFERMIMLMNTIQPVLSRYRVNAKRRYDAERGIWPGGRPPLGCKIGEGRVLERDPAHWQTVEFIFERWLATRSIMQVVQDCKREGYRTRGGRYLVKGTIGHVIKNRTYDGLLKFSYKQDGEKVSEWLPGAHDPFLPPGVFESAQALFKTPGKRGRRTATPLLYSLVVELESGLPMVRTYTLKKGRKFEYYYVRAARESASNAANLDKVKVKSVPLDMLNDLVMGEIVRLAASGEVEASEAEFMAEVDAFRARSEEQVEHVRAATEKMIVNREALGELIANGTEIDSDLLFNSERILKELRNERAELREQLSILKTLTAHRDFLSSALTELSQDWRSTSSRSLTVLNNKLLQIIKRIEVHENGFNLVLKGLPDDAAVHSFVARGSEAVPMGLFANFLLYRRHRLPRQGISIKEAALRLGYATETVWALIRSRRLKARRGGWQNTLGVDPRSLRAFEGHYPVQGL